MTISSSQTTRRLFRGSQASKQLQHRMVDGHARRCLSVLQVADRSVPHKCRTVSQPCGCESPSAVAGPTASISTQSAKPAVGDTQTGHDSTAETGRFSETGYRNLASNFIRR